MSLSLFCLTASAGEAGRTPGAPGDSGASIASVSAFFCRSRINRFIRRMSGCSGFSRSSMFRRASWAAASCCCAVPDARLPSPPAMAVETSGFASGEAMSAIDRSISAARSLSRLIDSTSCWICSCALLIDGQVGFEL